MKELIINFLTWAYHTIPYAIPLLFIFSAYALRYTGWHIKLIPDYDAKIESLTKNNDLLSAFPSNAEKSRLKNLLAIKEHRTYTAIKKTTSIFDSIFGYKIISTHALDKCILFSLIYTPAILIISWAIIGGEENKGWFAMPNFSLSGRLFVTILLITMAAISIKLLRKSTINAKFQSQWISKIYITIALHLILLVIAAMYGIISYSVMRASSDFSIGATVISWATITSIYISLVCYQNFIPTGKRIIVFTASINLLFIFELFIAAIFASEKLTRAEIILGLPSAMAIAATSILIVTTSIFIAIKYTRPGYAFIITAISTLINASILPSAASDIITSGRSSEEAIILSSAIVGSVIIFLMIILQVIAYKIIGKIYYAFDGGIFGKFFVLLIILLYAFFIRLEIIGPLKNSSHNDHIAFITNIYLILFLFPIWNGLIDMLSVATTRYLLRNYEKSQKSWWWMVIIDTAASVATIAILIFGLFFIEGMSGLGSTHKTQATDIGSIIDSKPLMLWTISLGLTNMVPTIIHLSLITASTWAGWILRDKDFLFYLGKKYYRELNNMPTDAKSENSITPPENKTISKSQAIALINAVKFDWIIGSLLPLSLIIALLIPLWKSLISDLLL